MPSAHIAFAGVGFDRLAELLFTHSNALRLGAGEGDSTVYAAFPSLDHDTLAFIPYPYEAIASGRAARPATSTAAISRNRVMLEHLAQGWTREFPRSAGAYETLARTLELEGRIGISGASDSSALQALDHARSLAADTLERRRLGIMRARLLLVSGDFSGARTLADSILAKASGTDPAEADALKALAALTGHVQRTIELLRVEAPTDHFRASTGMLVQPPLPVAEAARSLLGYVVFGTPADSITATRQRVERALESYVPSANRALVREAVLAVPLRLAYPVTPVLALQREGGSGDYLLDVQRAASKHDTVAVHRRLAAIAKMRALDRPGELSIYLTYQEAWLLLQVGDTTGATRQLDASLTALPALGPFVLDYVQDAAFLVRAMALRSDLASKSGDQHTAERWAGAVSELWAGADAPLQAEVARMRVRAAGGVR